MNRISWLILLAIITALNSCNTPEQDTLPDSKEEQQKLLSEKKKQLKNLQDQIDTLEKLIAKSSGKSPEDGYTLVEVDTLEKQVFKKFITLPAEVITDDLVTVSSETGGRIIKLLINEGDYVKRGTVIAEMDNETARLQKEEMEKRLELARTVYERQKRLWDQEIGSEIQYLEAKNNVEAMEKTLASLNEQLNKSVVTAPISGVVEEKLSRQGEVLAPGQPIAYMLNSNRVKVSADVPESYLNSVRKGQEINMYFPALDREERARISLVGSSINPANRTFKIEMDMANPGNVLKPNMLAEVKILEEEKKDALGLIVDYIQQEVGGKKFVYILNAKSKPPKASKQYIKTGISYDNRIVIEGGLEAGELIITKGSFDVEDGQEVKIAN